VPLRRSRTVRTTSMPTPRPDTLGDFGSGAETRLEDEVEDVLGVRGAERLPASASVCERPGANDVQIDAAAIVADFDDDLRALMIRALEKKCRSGLSGVEALAGRLDAVIDGVADKVR